MGHTNNTCTISLTLGQFVDLVIKNEEIQILSEEGQNITISGVYDFNTYPDYDVDEIGFKYSFNTYVTVNGDETPATASLTTADLLVFKGEIHYEKYQDNISE